MQQPTAPPSSDETYDRQYQISDPGLTMFPWIRPLPVAVIYSPSPYPTPVYDLEMGSRSTYDSPAGPEDPAGLVEVFEKEQRQCGCEAWRLGLSCSLIFLFLLISGLSSLFFFIYDLDPLDLGPFWSWAVVTLPSGVLLILTYIFIYEKTELERKFWRFCDDCFRILLCCGCCQAWNGMCGCC